MQNNQSFFKSVWNDVDNYSSYQLRVARKRAMNIWRIDLFVVNWVIVTEEGHNDLLWLWG